MPVAKASKGGGQTFVQRSRAVGAAEKAVYHNLEGAGRSHVRRPFFDLNADDEAAIVQIVSDHLDEIVKT